MSDYDVYPDRPSADLGATAAPEGDWQVMVEYANGGEMKPPTIVEVFSHRFGTRPEAHRYAEQVAREYQPPDPWSPRSRDVYRDGEGFLVVVAGAMQTFHFSVRLVQHVLSS